MTIRDVVAERARKLGARNVARQLLTDRATLTSWLAGLSREGTALLLEQRAKVLFSCKQEADK